MFAGGGTGGHLFPGIAVAREVRRRHPEAPVVFVGTGRDLEVRALSRDGFPLEQVRAVGLVGRSWRAIVHGLVTLPRGFADAWRLLSRHRPRVVVGLGGYSSGPLVLEAALRRTPTMLLEQNAVPGVTNRLLSRVVRAAAVSYATSLSYFGSRGFVSGNPVRTGFFEAPDARPEATTPHLLVLGGSQGAHAINMALVEAAPALASGPVSFRVTHQAGAADVDVVASAYQRAGLDATVVPFVDQMEDVMAGADIVVCRAGATTLAELAAAGRPSILVPYPYAAHDHQRRNAQVVQQAGAADVVDPSDLTATGLVERIMALATDGPARCAMASASRDLGVPDAAQRIVDRMEPWLSAA